MHMQGGNKFSYNAETFWYYPRGGSITHKGVDILAKKSTEITSSLSALFYMLERLEWVVE
jgi:hypothetical protein